MTTGGRAPEEDGDGATVLERPHARAQPPNDVHEALTQARATTGDEKRSSGTSSTGVPTNTLATSPLGALDHAELLRTRQFCLVGLCIAVVAGCTIPFLPGGYYTTRMMMTGIVIAMLGLVYLLHRTRSPLTFRDGFGHTVGWYIPVVAVTLGVPYFGPASPAPILLVLGIFVIGLGGSRGLAVATYLTAALGQGVTGMLVATGVIVDPGFIHANYLTRPIQVVAQGLIQMILLGTFIIARATRRSSLSALAELEKAVRAVAQREALLEEARDELRRALGSGRGRFTDQTLGHYQLGDVIGRGAMGEVYQGIDTRGGAAVAVKMLAHASLGNPHHVQRFLRELQTASQIDSPNVVRVLEVGEHPLPHLVMERLHGRDLAAVLRSNSGMSHDRVIDMVRQVGAGISAAGAAGIVHRDLKPQNVFLAGATWKILDFGVSRVLESSTTLTTGHVVGTPAYMAPEQAKGDHVDHRTDLYALAAIAYRALTGHTPFASGEVADTLYRVVHTAPMRPSSHTALPIEVDLVLAIGLAKQPDQRFASAAELADALAGALVGQLSDELRIRGRALVNAGAYAAAQSRPKATRPS